MGRKNLISKNLEKLNKRVSREFDKIGEQIKDARSELQDHAGSLEKKVRKPVSALLSNLDRFREKELKRVQAKYHQLADEISGLQEKLNSALKSKSSGKKADVGERASSREDSLPRGVARAASGQRNFATGGVVTAIPASKLTGVSKSKKQAEQADRDQKPKKPDAKAAKGSEAVKAAKAAKAAKAGKAEKSAKAAKAGTSGKAGKAASKSGADSPKQTRNSKTASETASRSAKKVVDTRAGKSVASASGADQPAGEAKNKSAVRKGARIARRDSGAIGSNGATMARSASLKTGCKAAQKTGGKAARKTGKSSAS